MLAQSDSIKRRVPYFIFKNQSEQIISRVQFFFRASPLSLLRREERLVGYLRDRLLVQRALLERTPGDHPEKGEET
jgi:hypothetical protein